ncbi:hypothetical protein BaRGS_00038965, partial [Batillaria attramentaria]
LLPADHKQRADWSKSKAATEQTQYWKSVGQSVNHHRTQQDPDNTSHSVKRGLHNTSYSVQQDPVTSHGVKRDLQNTLHIVQRDLDNTSYSVQWSLHNTSHGVQQDPDNTSHSVHQDPENTSHSVQQDSVYTSHRVKRDLENTSHSEQWDHDKDLSDSSDPGVGDRRWPATKQTLFTSTTATPVTFFTSTPNRTFFAAEQAPISRHETIMTSSATGDAIDDVDIDDLVSSGRLWTLDSTVKKKSKPIVKQITQEGIVGRRSYKTFSKALRYASLPLILMGLVTNTIAFRVFRGMPTTVTNTYMMCLTFFDIAFLIFAISSSVLAGIFAALKPQVNHSQVLFLYIVHHYLILSARQVIVCTTAFMCLDRFLTLACPFKSMKLAVLRYPKLLILTVSVVIFLFNSHKLLKRETKNDAVTFPGTNQTSVAYLGYTQLYLDNRRLIDDLTIASSCLFQYLPLLVMTVSNISLVASLHKYSRRAGAAEIAIRGRCSQASRQVSTGIDRYSPYSSTSSFSTSLATHHDESGTCRSRGSKRTTDTRWTQDDGTTSDANGVEITTTSGSNGVKKTTTCCPNSVEKTTTCGSNGVQMTTTCGSNGVKTSCGSKSVEKTTTCSSNREEKTTMCASNGVKKTTTCGSNGVEKTTTCGSNGVEKTTTCGSDGVKTSCGSKSVDKTTTCSSNSVEMTTMCGSNGVEMTTTCASNGVEMTTTCASNGVEMTTTCASNSVEMTTTCASNGVEMTTTYGSNSVEKITTSNSVGWRQTPGTDERSSSTTNRIKNGSAAVVRPKKRNSRALQFFQLERHKSITVIVYSVLFLLLALPLALLPLLQRAAPQFNVFRREHYLFLAYLRTFPLLDIVSATINFFVFFIKGGAFRVGVYRTCRGCCRRHSRDGGRKRTLKIKQLTAVLGKDHVTGSTGRRGFSSVVLQGSYKLRHS